MKSRVRVPSPAPTRGSALSCSVIRRSLLRQCILTEASWQSNGRDGFAGAAQFLGREDHGAVLAVPYNPDDLSDAIRTALDMPLDQRKARHQTMIGTIREVHVLTWTHRYRQNISDVAMKGLLSAKSGRRPSSDGVRFGVNTWSLDRSGSRIMASDSRMPPAPRPALAFTGPSPPLPPPHRPAARPRAETAPHRRAERPAVLPDQRLRRSTASSTPP